MLIAYATAGNGHRSAAAAIAESVHAAGRIGVLVDVLDFCDPVFRLCYSDVYQMAGKHSHGICGAMYRLTDIHPDKSPIVRMIDRISLNRTRPFADFIKKTTPEAFVATHFLPMSIAARMKKHGLYSGPLFAVITDYDLHHLWFSEEVDCYFAGSGEIVNRLTGMGVPPERIVLSGIPVRRKIAEAAHGMARPAGSSLSVLFLASSIADDKAVQIVDLLLSLPGELNLKVICGRNRSLLKTLEKHPLLGKAGFEALGFTEDIHRHYAEADLLVTKPGGLTVAEALCFGLPMIFVYPIPFQETRNAEFIQKQGGGWAVSDLVSLGRMVRLLSCERGLLAKAGTACSRIARPGAAKIIADEVARRSFHSAGCGCDADSVLQATGTR
ncbi:glycosyltransferase [Aminivibrio sp.]|jgi:processive 1,2-diacylglycerol beta-glucosyltransferase|uniref:MGDG synthase family glycosyltransferase n=1 Tax=Aminivibrio sp. TaxID=1872489 RepID=UPI001A61ACE1|nr:glycosyltransferase [Aminivibrio sp.]MBL3540291.1 hypothetical protein [Aminivibrio sp.]